MELEIVRLTQSVSVKHKGGYRPSMRSEAGPYPCSLPRNGYLPYQCGSCDFGTGDRPPCRFGKRPSVSKPIGPHSGKVCAICGSGYEPTGKSKLGSGNYGKSKYCSDACRRKAINSQRRKRRSKVSDMIY